MADDGDSWEEFDPDSNPFPGVNADELAKAAYLHILIKNKQEELEGLDQKLQGEITLLIKREEAYYNAFLKKKEFNERRRKSSEKHIESERRMFWIPKATAQKQANIENGKAQLQNKFNIEKEEIEMQLTALQKSLDAIDSNNKVMVDKIVQLYFSQFCTKERFVPKPGTRGGLAKVDLSLVQPHILPPSFSREGLEKAGVLVDKEDVVNVEGITEFDLEVLKKVVAKVHESAGSWIDAAYEETFHWHSGKPLDEYKNFLEDYDDQRSTATFYWHYGRSLELSLKPPETNEFSQHLRIHVQIQPQKFPEAAPNPKKAAKNPNAKTKVKPGAHTSKSANTVISAQWKVLVSNSSNLLSKPRGDTINEARKLVLQMVGHPMAPNNEERNLQASKIMILILKWQLDAMREPNAPITPNALTTPNASATPNTPPTPNIPTTSEKVQLFTTIRDLHVNFQAFLNQEAKDLIAEALTILDGGCSIRFQMEECGAFLLKDANPHYFSHPDIPFIPDAWQKEVLQKIDEDASCLIVAPTSAGKSFISFYTISHVLQTHVRQEETTATGSSKKAAKQEKKQEKKTKAANKKNKNQTEPEKEETTETDNGNNNNNNATQNQDATKTKDSKIKGKSLQAKVVFVAPTLPLCNQMIAMVSHRYHQKVKVGVFTAEFRFNVHACEVLICTPVIFEILLMSPSCESWRLNLKYVILDEIHFTFHKRVERSKTLDERVEDPEITDRAMSDAYSRIFAILECPFLALSATVQNPENTRAWLENIRNFGLAPGVKESQVYLLPTNYATLKRWVDLQSYVFAPPSTNLRDDVAQNYKLTKPPIDGQLRHLHPLSFLRFANNRDVSNIRMSPLEMIQLYDKIVEVVGQENVKHLDPENLKQTTQFVDTNQCTEYGNLLLKTIAEFSPEIRKSIGEKFPYPYSLPKIEQEQESSKLEEIEEIEEEEESEENKDNENNNKNDNNDKNNKNNKPEEKAQKRKVLIPLKYFMADLISNLSYNNMLPAIAFSDNTVLIERAFEEVVEYLERLEAQFGNKPIVTERFVKKEESRSERDYDDEEEGRGGGGGGSGGGGGNRREEEEEEEGGRVDFRKIEREMQKQSLDARLDVVHSQVWPVDFNYSLRKRTDSLDTEGIAYWVSRMLTKLRMKASHLYIRGLARGIAIYHSGVPKPYRDLVEALFRSGNIQFVISTQALAVGVNMPCKSVVFLTDSRYIHKVEFEQMRGRAGRRGFDHVGNTVFCFFSPSRVSSLLLSPMQPLLAIPALNIDSILRAIILQNKVADKASVSRAVGRWLYTHPTMEASKEANPPAVFLFSVELLFRLHLINKQAKPIGLSGLVAHNFDVYPANYAIAYLIQVGALDEVIKPFNLTEKAPKAQCRQALISLISIFAYLAARIPAKPGMQRVLSTLPNKVTTALATYNLICLDCVQDCSMALKVTNLPAPNIELIPPENLNSYAVDFFRYKTIQTVIKDNYLSDNYAYRQVVHFGSFLQKVKTAVAHGVSDPLHPLCRATSTLASKYSKYIENIEY